MIFRTYVLFVFGLFTAAMVFSCSSPKQSKKVICVIDADSLTMADISTLVPDSASMQEKVFRAALEFSLANESTVSGTLTPDKKLYTELSTQLSLQTGFTWDQKAVSHLYCAAKVLRKQFQRAPTALAIAMYIDSLFAHSIKLDTSIRRDAAIQDSFFTKTIGAKTRKNLESVLQSAFFISQKTSIVLTDFLISEDIGGPTSADVSKLIQGLVADTHHVAKKALPQTIATPVQNAQDAKLALKYRPQQCISDSIKKHIPNLEALYKKQLKVHSGMAGTIWVTFEILPEGNVLSAKIKTSEINQKEFIVPFINYIQQIRFSAIPAAVGTMTFEFPFEFSPEN